MMHIAMLGFFCAEYPIALANALAKTNDVTLFLSLPHLALRFPGVSDFTTWLREEHIVSEAISLQLIEHPETGRYIQKLKMAQNTASSLKELRPDVVHYQSAGNPWFPLAMPRLRHLSLVATIHDVTHHSGDRPSKATLFATNWMVTRFAHQIIVHGQEQADSLRKIYLASENKTNVVPMGGFPLYRAFESEKREESNPVVLFFGRFRAYKGIDVLIKAAPIIAARIPHVRIIIAGAGESEDAFAAVDARPDLFEVHNRYIPADEVPGFFEKAAVVVLPYRDATQSAVVPLAYTFGKPVVATNVGSIPEIVDDGRTGLLVPPGNEQALAEAVITLLENPERREAMGRAAASKAKLDLSWDDIAARTLAVYRRADGNSPSLEPAAEGK